MNISYTKIAALLFLIISFTIYLSADYIAASISSKNATYTLKAYSIKTDVYHLSREDEIIIRSKLLRGPPNLTFKIIYSAKSIDISGEFISIYSRENLIYGPKSIDNERLNYHLKAKLTGNYLMIIENPTNETAIVNVEYDVIKISDVSNRIKTGAIIVCVITGLYLFISFYERE